MWHFIARKLKYFFTHKLRNDETFRLIGHHVGRIIRRTFRKIALHYIEKCLQIRLLFCRNRYNRCKRIFIFVICNNWQCFFTCNLVDLIDNQNDRSLRCFQPFDDVALARPHLFCRIDDKENRIDFFQGAFCCFDHVRTKFVLRLMDTWRIEKDNLGIGLCQNT